MFSNFPISMTFRLCSNLIVLSVVTFSLENFYVFLRLFSPQLTEYCTFFSKVSSLYMLGELRFAFLTVRLCLHGITVVSDGYAEFAVPLNFG